MSLPDHCLKGWGRVRVLTVYSPFKTFQEEFDG
jgi:hypothetical protein